MIRKEQQEVQKAKGSSGKKWWLWGIIIFVIILVLSSGGNGGQDTTQETILLEEGFEESIIEENEFMNEGEVETFQSGQDFETYTPILQLVEDEPIKSEVVTQGSQQETKIEEPMTGEKWYTSSHHTAKYYYHESCQGWKGLSEQNLRVFGSEAELLSKYNRTLHPDCNPY